MADVFLYKLPVHRAATAYRVGSSIAENARAHAENGPIKKFDFKNFFPGIRDVDWIKYCLENKVFTDEEDIALSTKILFKQDKKTGRLCLAIGAPTSPLLSNILMYRFDEYLQGILAAEGVTYTRYADNITFSAERTGHLVNSEVLLRRATAKIKSPKLTINEQKTVLATKKYRRSVTGVVITNDKKLSLGRTRKRKISAEVHHYTLGKLAPTDIGRLAGWLAYANAIEPSFLERLSEKYGDSVVQGIRRSKVEGRRLPLKVGTEKIP